MPTSPSQLSSRELPAGSARAEACLSLISVKPRQSLLCLRNVASSAMLHVIMLQQW